ncbi:NAD(P)H-binding protein [Stenotrophomonas maltophilia]|uniref:NAD(P)H-binding protein n=1 Tax=Stenotrophomonas maltophilia TaxID=40324 RepID=UPI003016D1E1
MSNVLELGASGQIAHWAVQMLGQHPEVEQTLYLRNPMNVTGSEPANATVVIGDVLDKKGLALAMHGKDIVYANLAGKVDKQTETIISVMKSQGVKSLIFVNSLGIYDEVPGAWCLVPSASGTRKRLASTCRPIEPRPT